MDFLGSLGYRGFSNGDPLFSSSWKESSGSRTQRPGHASHFAHVISSSSSSSSCSSSSLLRYSVSLFTLNSDVRIRGLVSSAAVAFDKFQTTYNGQLGFSSCFQKNLHLNNTNLFGSWNICVGYWGLLSSWFDGLPKNTSDSHGDKKTTTALLGNSSDITSKTRRWTNIFIGINVLMYVAQAATNGKILLLGAKVNSLIDKGQVWRFLTPAFLHASLPHLVTNCYSLNSIGPIIEAQAGSARFLAVYLGSALTGFFMSYSFNRAPAVGASGAVFGLVGSLAVFLLRHKDILSGADQGLSNLSRMIAINMVLGLATSKIDNWGHLGGFLGGAVISWVVGPAFSYKRIPGEKKMVLVDRPPLSYIVRRLEP